jgi:hypothetical protein
MNINLVTVYDAKGEAFEMSRSNATDAVTNLGWTYSKAPKEVTKEDLALAPLAKNTELQVKAAKAIAEGAAAKDANAAKTAEFSAVADVKSFDEIAAEKALAEKAATVGKKVK